MRYIDVNWQHDSDEEPYRLVSEIDQDQYETRKLEFFRTGQVGYAAKKLSAKNTMLGSERVPTLEELNSQEEFHGKSITKQEFEELWKLYVAKSS